MASVVHSIGRSQRWPDICVGCCGTRHLSKARLVFYASDGPYVPNPQSGETPMLGRLTWTYPICGKCMDYPREGKSTILIGDITAVAVAAIAGLVFIMAGVSLGWLLAVIALELCYIGFRFLIKYDERRYHVRVAPRNRHNMFLLCTRIIGSDGREIIGFSEFLEQAGRGDVICTFEFQNEQFASEFARLNPAPEKRLV